MSENKHYQHGDTGLLYPDFSAFNQIVLDEIKNKDLYFEKRCHDCFEIYLIEKSIETCSIPDIQLTLNACEMHLVFPGDNLKCDHENIIRLHRFIVPASVWEMISSNLLFPVSFYKKHSAFDLPPEIFNKLLHECKSINDEIKKEKNIWEIVLLRIRVITLIISKEASKHFLTSTERSATHKLVTFFMLVMVHFREEKNVRFYADKISLTPNYLNTICRKYYNRTASSIINHEIILEIMMQLINSNKSIKEISIDLGFKDLSGFSSFFNNNTGMSPRDFLLMNGRSYAN